MLGSSLATSPKPRKASSLVCKDCKHVVSLGENSKCRAPYNMKVSNITGETIIGASGYEFCEILRKFGHPCGPEGNKFEPVTVVIDVAAQEVSRFKALPGPVAKPWWKFWGNEETA